MSRVPKPSDLKVRNCSQEKGWGGVLTWSREMLEASRAAEAESSNDENGKAKNNGRETHCVC